MLRMSKYITNTRVATQLGLEKSMKIVVDYLIANRTVIATPDDVSSIFSTRAFTSTPISEIFEKCIVPRHLNEFAIIANPSKAVVENIPDALTMSSLVMDLEQVQAGEALSAYRELYRKVVMNITNLVKMTNTGLQISALHELHSMFVKALLVRSYFRSADNQWLTPIMQQYVVRTYSLFVATIISNHANLNNVEMNQVAAVFALYMYQLLSAERGDITIPPQYLNINFLGNRSDLLYVAETCKEYAKGPLDLQKCCEIIAHFGPSRLGSYSLDVFYRQCGTLGLYNDAVSTRMAFDYPPYWVWLLLLSLSKVKTGMMGTFLQRFNLKQAGMKLALDLITYPNLLK